MGDIQEDFEGAVKAYISGDWQLANRYADRAKDREPKLNRDEFRRRARDEAKRLRGPIRGPGARNDGRRQRKGLCISANQDELLASGRLSRSQGCVR